MSIWRRRTTSVLVAGIIIVIVAVAVAFIVSRLQQPVQLRLGSGVFQVQLAKDAASRERGLAGVGSLKPSEGLLMVFDTDDTWPIWMKDMKLPLDIIWLNAQKKVVYIVRNVPADDQDRLYQPKDPSRYVVELPAGSVQTYNIRLGETAIFELEGVQ